MKLNEITIEYDRTERNGMKRFSNSNQDGTGKYNDMVSSRYLFIINL